MSLLGCRQVVRQRTLNPPLAGSNPPTPVQKYNRQKIEKCIIFSIVYYFN